MPSSYSPSLRIELIAPGEQAGTWGTTTNTNLGTLVEDAISGYVAVTPLSTNQALTALNGAADQARSAIVELTSSPGADFAIYAPPESKQYTIVNSTVNTATIYNSTALGNTTAAGTGVAVPAGKTMTVWSDGENFAVQNSLIVGDVVGNVVGNVTGNVAGQLNGSITSATTAVTQATSDNSTKLATTAFVQAVKASLHPVGSIYINATNNTNPATLLGFGTWTAFGAGRVPVGFNAADPLFDTAEETGGSKDAIVVSHTHSITDPGHNHTVVIQSESTDDIDYSNTGVPYLSDRSTTTTGAAQTGITINATGSSGTNANLQPYVTVYMWKRVS